MSRAVRIGAEQPASTLAQPRRPAQWGNETPIAAIRLIAHDR